MSATISEPRLRDGRRSRVRQWMAALAMGVMAGCASPPLPLPSTTVILLPDEDGKVGAVTVKNAAGSQEIVQAYGAVTADAAGPAAAQHLQRDAVEARFGDLMKAQPSKPRSFVLYFRLDRAELTDQSRTLLSEVLKTARDRAPTRIAVYGHADAIGGTERNLRLSAERAAFVAAQLRAAEPGLKDIEVEYFGDRWPLVPARDGTAQPLNRRVEVTIL